MGTRYRLANGVYPSFGPGYNLSNDGDVNIKPLIATIEITDPAGASPLASLLKYHVVSNTLSDVLTVGCALLTCFLLLNYQEISGACALSYYRLKTQLSLRASSRAPG